MSYGSHPTCVPWASFQASFRFQTLLALTAIQKQHITCSLYASALSHICKSANSQTYNFILHTCQCSILKYGNCMYLFIAMDICPAKQCRVRLPEGNSPTIIIINLNSEIYRFWVGSPFLSHLPTSPHHLPLVLRLPPRGSPNHGFSFGSIHCGVPYCGYISNIFIYNIIIILQDFYLTEFEATHAKQGSSRIGNEGFAHPSARLRRSTTKLVLQ